MPGDEIWAVNGVDVTESTKDAVVRLVKQCPDTITLTVSQPRPSSDVSAGQRERLTSARRLLGPFYASAPLPESVFGAEEHRGYCWCGDLCA